MSAVEETNQSQQHGGHEDPLTDHEYDGIREYDNPMPTWWRRTFWLTFWFSVAYYVHFQLTGKGVSVEESYAQDMREYREFLAAQSLGEEMSEQSLAKVMADEQLVADGRTVFLARCLQCHADRGQGNIGPNLTDDHWLYGSGSLMDIYGVVSEGRQQKGMPPWGRMLRPMELAQVVAYVGSIRNTNVPGRPPQGRKVEPVPATAAEAPAEGEKATAAEAPAEGEKAAAAEAPAEGVGAGVAAQAVDPAAATPESSGQSESPTRPAAHTD